MVQGDPKQLQELLGINMGMVISAVFQLIGSLIISFVFGWKLSLVALCVTVPLVLASGWYRSKYENEFVKMSAAVSFLFHHEVSSRSPSGPLFSALTSRYLTQGEIDELPTSP